MDKNNLKNKSLTDKIKYICSITVKNEGRALNAIFALCLVCIIALCIYLYRSSTVFYNQLDSTMENNISMNIELLRNEQTDYLEDLINNIISNFKHKENL